MRKAQKTLVSLVLVLTLVVASAISVSAHYEGYLSADIQEYTVPKINANNNLKIDGKVDVNGEWYGAAVSTVNLTEEDASDYSGFWDASVWGQDYDGGCMCFEDIHPEHRNLYTSYYLWDENGLYVAVVCDTDSTPCQFNPGFVTGADTTGYTHRVDSFTPMIRLGSGDANPYQWLELWVDTTTGEPFWNDDSGNYYTDNHPVDFEIEYATWRSETPNENGAYPYSLEAYISWDAIKYGGGLEKVVEWTAAPDEVVQIGQIFLDGTGKLNDSGAPYDWGRAFDCPGWNNFNCYILSAETAPNAPAASTAETEPETEAETTAPETEPETEPETVETAAPETTAPETVETPAASTAPQTFDIGVIAAVAAAISAAGYAISRKRR